MPAPIRIRRAISTASFNPSNYGGGTLKGWFKADSLTLADGASVSTWLDDSGNGNNATAGTAPVYKVGIRNGKPGVLFAAASSQFLAANGLSSVNNGADNPFSFTLAAMHATVVAQQRYFSWGRSVVSANPFVAPDMSTSAYRIDLRDDAALNKSTTGGTVSTSPIIFSGVMTGTAGSTWLNGAPLDTARDLDVGTKTIDRFSIGCLGRTTNSNFLDAYIFELIIYSSALSASDRQAIERALGSKWGITVA